MEHAWTVIIASISAAVILVASKLFPYLLTWRKQGETYFLEQHRVLLDELKSQVHAVRDEIRTLQAAYAELQAANAELQAANKALREDVVELKLEIRRLERGNHV